MTDLDTLARQAAEKAVKKLNNWPHAPNENKIAIINEAMAPLAERLEYLNRGSLERFVKAYLAANPLEDQRSMGDDLVKRGDGRVERLCEHGVGHPIQKLTEEWDDAWMGIHGCDGCCQEWNDAE